MGQNEDDETSWTRSDVREKAEGLLARRGHSRSELLGKLLDRDVPEHLANETCDALVEEGVVDDLAFATRQARLLRDQNWGPHQIDQKLRDHGVGAEDRDVALAEVGGEEVWLAHCYARFESEFAERPEAMSRRQKGKAYRHLERRGFPGWIARRIVLDGYVPEENE